MMKIYSKSKIANRLVAVSIALSIFGAANAQTTYTFTSASATGSAGPTQAQINTAYAATNLNGSVTINPQGIQNFTIPITGLYRIESNGAQGGTESVSKWGGRGAKMIGDFNLTAGTVLKILVGQQGSSVLTYYGGGGGTFVADLANTPLVVAGGGGGAGGTAGGNGVDAVTTTSGTAGSAGGSGGVGGNGGFAVQTNGGSGGGFYTDGTGTFSSPQCSVSAGKAFVNGGAGGQYSSWLPGGFGGGGGGWSSTGNGGGGGGYSGGGTSGATYLGGGGGGSFNAGTNQNNTAGINTGNGYVIITQLYSAIITQSAAITCFSLCNAVLTGTAVGGTAPYTYTWLPSNSNATVQPNLCAGVYTLIAKDFNNQISSSIFTVTQPALLSPSVTAVANASCFGNSNGAATVTPFGGTGPYTYSWVPTAFTTSAVSTLTAGVYTCQVKDANLCTATVSVNITQPAAIDGSATNSNVCVGNTVALNGSGATSYTWSGSVVNGVAFTPTASSSYTVVGSNSVTGCTGTAVVSVSLSPTPTISITNPTICVGQATTLSPNGAATYTYSGGSAVVTPSATSVYTITGTSAAGCQASAITVTVVVSPCTGINSTLIENVKVSVYPNPSNGLFTIESNSTEVKSITVTDVNGKLIEKINVQSSSETMDIRKYNDGIYFIKITTPYGDKTMKIIKSK